MDIKTVKDRYIDLLESIPDEYIQSVLDEYDLKEKDLEKNFWGTFIKKRYDSGHKFGFDLGKMFNKPNCIEDVRSVLDDLNRLVIRVKIKQGEMFISKYLILDFSENCLFYELGDVGDDYTKAESIKIKSSLKEEILDYLKKNIGEVELNATQEPIPVYDVTILIMSKNKLIKKYYVKSLDKVEVVKNLIDKLEAIR